MNVHIVYIASSVCNQMVDGQFVCADVCLFDREGHNVVLVWTGK